MSVRDQVGGFSPGAAARLKASDGRRVFVKAFSPDLNPDAPDMYSAEAGVVVNLPASVPSPRLLWSYDEGPGGWVMLVFEDIEGRNPTTPWKPDEIDRVVDALISLSTSLTPAPIGAGRSDDIFGRRICGWNLLQEEPWRALGRWSSHHLSRPAELERQAVKAGEGETLLHLDIRADNLLLTPDRVYIVDWPHVGIGAPWVDFVFFAPSVAMQGGPDPDTLLLWHPAARTADEDSVTAVIAAVAGFFTQRCLLPAPPGLPGLRAFQAAQGAVARRWLAERTSWL